ncbi:MAG: DUF4381 domain-containing protein [Pseudomonadales bacterium]
MSELIGDTFGNYLIRGIEEIALPEPVSWFPQTIGWKILALLALLFAAYKSYHAAKRWWRNRYRRSALLKLKVLEEEADGDYSKVAAELPSLLKAAALHAYPRAQVAALSGESWLEFLDAHYSGPSFRSGTGQHLLTIAYQSRAQWHLEPADARTLITMCRRWLRQHKASTPQTSHA